MISKRQREQLARRLREARRRGQQSARSKPDNDPLIGYVARGATGMFCDGDGCIVAGSRDELRRYLGKSDFQVSTIDPAKFSQILWVMQRGGAYCFDEEAYGRFLAPGKRAGIALTEEDFSNPGPRGMHFVRVQIFNSGF